MAPNTRSSRAASRNASRPATPLDGPSAAHTSSFSEPARPRKQRKTGRNTRVAADSVDQDLNGSAFTTTPELTLDQQSANGTRSVPPAQRLAPWTEPELPATYLSSWEHDRKRKAGIAELDRAFGSYPTKAEYDAAGITPSESVQAKWKETKGKWKRAPAKKKVNEGSARATPTGGDRPQSSASTGDEHAQTAASRPASRQSSLPRGGGGMSTRSTRSRTHNDVEPTEAAPVNGHEPEPEPVPVPPTEVRGLKKFTPQQLLDIMGVAISQADSLNDPRVADGLRHIRQATSSDPFLFTAVEGALNKPIDPHDKAVFQSTVREAIKQVQAAKEQQAEAADVTEMERSQSTRSGTTSSSLSTAKSLDVETFAPAMSSEPAPAKGKAPAAQPKGKGRGRGKRKRDPEPEPEPETEAPKEKPGKRGTKIWEPLPYNGPPRPYPAEQRSQGRKRRLQADPAFSEESLVSKRIKLSLTQPKPGLSTESHVRSVPKPTSLPPPSDQSSVSSAESNRALEPPQDELVRRSERSKATPKANGRPRKRQRKTKDQADEIDNIDFCRTCGGSGNLLCCDGCIDSFHFTCLDPPQDPESPPEGKWFCPSCANKAPLAALSEQLDDEPSDFQLPDDIRNHFEGVTTAKGHITGKPPGTFVQKPVIPNANPKQRLKKPALAKDTRDLYRTEDDSGNRIFCIRCRLRADGTRAVILCDYCPCWWHLDCLDPPMTHPPTQKEFSEAADHYWKCPNHIENVVDEVKKREGFAYPRLRRPREPRYVDVDVIPNEGEMFNYTDTRMSGVVYRVPDTGMILNFISSVKRKHAEEEAAKKRALAAERAAEAARQQDLIDKLPTSDRDAIMSLISMSKESLPPSNPYTERIGRLVNELVSNAPEETRSQTSEVELLKSLQDLVNRRIKSLTPAESAGSSN